MFYLKRVVWIFLSSFAIAATGLNLLKLNVDVNVRKKNQPNWRVSVAPDSFLYMIIIHHT